MIFMDMSIKQLHKLTELAILTPYNLLENIKLPEYETISYSKKDGNIECTLTGSSGFSAVYMFNSNEALQLATIQFEGETIEVFNRKQETDAILAKFNNHSNDISSKKAM